MIRYTNPILPGFYPDPSVCRVGEDYYLVNSSFEFFPGVPLWHSRDLLHWEQMGHVLTEDSQLPLAGCRASGGIFAPTIRCHNGRFYMVTTNTTGGGNFFVWADDIHGPWSQPIYVKQGGIDPSLFWDDDGTVYFHSTHFDETGRQCIGQCTLDLATGEMLTETRPIWYGTGGKCPEGPHMYKRGDKYYLMIAEGGTEYGHMETIARSDSPWGPFESCPHNPILTARDINPRSGFPQALGHADLVEDTAGQWWIVFHGIRPSQFMLHHMGRETMIAPVTWDENGWPVVNGGQPITEVMETPAPAGYTPKEAQTAWTDTFSSQELSNRWAHLRNPNRENYTLGQGLTLRGCDATLDDCDSPTFVGVRQGHFDAVVEANLEVGHLGEGAQLGLSVFHVPEHHYDLYVTRREGDLVAVLRRRVVDMVVESAPVVLPEGQPLTLRIDAGRLGYTFSAGVQGQPLTTLGTGSTQLLATEITICTFTGCFYGMYALGDSEGTFTSFSWQEKAEN